jgi:crotonobetainyl-CoA:carnitine CoA-transferase CaiB-like acyl-CoA transferase
MRPLDGITVVALEQAVAAPFATRQLADLGARVIKIERPGTGDFARHYDRRVHGLSSHFVWLNRSKESLTVDLKHDEARTILERLLTRADVFVQNLAPGATARLGMDSGTLRRRHPRLITCDISGYGTSGPYQAKKAYDLLVQAEAGLLSITGTPDTPSKVGISVADIAAGMYAYSGILTALLQREKTNTGAAIDVSLLEALGEWMSYAGYYAGFGGEPLPRTGPHHASIAPYGPFVAGDGLTVYLAIQNEREWQRFCASVLQQPALAGDARFASNAERVRHRPALHAAIEQVFNQWPAAELIDRLDRAQIANARMNTMVEFVQHPQLAARHRWRDVDSPVGPLPALLPPATLQGTEPVMGSIPDVGQQSEAILVELGFSSDDVARWRRAGAI